VKHGGARAFLRLEAGRSPPSGGGTGEGGEYNNLHYSAGPAGSRKKPDRREQLFNSLKWGSKT